jgi:DNA polymerase-3 subunit gamma/tau
MTSQVFYRKWRPQTLAEIVGQEQVTQTLSNALSSGRVSHAYLFYGPRGTGKTSTGRILAKALNCLSDGKGEPCNSCDMCLAITEGRALDVIEVDAASNTGVDDIRSLREKVNYAPNQARYKVYIIDEVHMLSNSASNALLKTLEEPPPQVIFILATTEIHKMLPTIMSRCQRFDFRRISRADVISKLSRICEKEGIKLEPEGFNLIAKSATGSLRDAENLLEQLTTYYGTEIGLQQVQAILGITGDQRAKELVGKMAAGDIAGGVAAINSVNSDGLDLRQFNREVVEYLRQLLLVKTGSEDAVDLTAEDKTELKQLAAKTSLAQISKAIKLFGSLELGFDNYSTLPLELALVDCIQPQAQETKSPPIQAKQEPPPQVKVKPTAKPPAAKAEPAPEPPAEAKADPPKAIKAEPAPAPEPKPEPVKAKAEPAETPTPTPPELNNEIERLRMNWRDVMEQAPDEVKRTSAIAILRSAGVTPVAIEEDTVILAFRYPIHKEKMETAENQQAARAVISNFLGRPCQVRCIHQPEDNHLVEAAKKYGAQVTSVEEK